MIFFFCFSQTKGAQCDKCYPERQKRMNFQQGFSCHCYVVPFSQIWVRASRFWRLQLVSKDTGLSPWHIQLQIRWMLPARGTLYFIADYCQFKSGYWIILQRMLSASQMQKTTRIHVAWQLCRVADSPKTCKCAGLRWTREHLCYVPAVICNARSWPSECYSGKPPVLFWSLRPVWLTLVILDRTGWIQRKH